MQSRWFWRTPTMRQRMSGSFFTWMTRARSQVAERWVLTDHTFVLAAWVIDNDEEGNLWAAMQFLPGVATLLRNISNKKPSGLHLQLSFLWQTLTQNCEIRLLNHATIFIGCAGKTHCDSGSRHAVIYLRQELAHQRLLLGSHSSRWCLVFCCCSWSPRLQKLRYRLLGFCLLNLVDTKPWRKVQNQTFPGVEKWLCTSEIYLPMDFQNAQSPENCGHHFFAPRLSCLYRHRHNSKQSFSQLASAGGCSWQLPSDRLSHGLRH